jgi:3-dehydroquinate synthase
MAASAGFEPLVVQSHAGSYSAEFDENFFARLAGEAAARTHLIIDRRLTVLYGEQLAAVLAAPSVLLVDALEENKSLEAMPRWVAHLLSKGVRRGDTLVAVGGGIIQDITCFLAATLLRGIPWRFYPTTLLAQADSCIGSKSSINVADAKNILGTFTPPRSIVIATRILETLDERDMRSGIGEMLKVHAIDGPASFDRIAADYQRLQRDRDVLRGYLRRSLEIKRRIIEADEFDTGLRRVMNYGHTFGHALETATGYAVPHGIAVTIGMDMANFAAVRLGRMDSAHHRRMHPILAANYRGFESQPVPLESFLAAIAKDKKNTVDRLGVILPDAQAKIEWVGVPNDEAFRTLCADYFARERRA